MTGPRNSAHPDPDRGSGDHPSLASLEAHTATPDADVAAHVATCSPCSEALDAVRQHAALGGELRTLLASDPQQRARLRPPEIEGYDDLTLLATGGQGVVWRAIQRSTHRPVALKLLAGAQHASPRTRARFDREVELAAALNHPQLVTVFDSGETRDGAPWFAMEFIEGQPFVQWARGAVGAGERRPHDQILRCLVQLCRAVEAAHRRGVLHRDLKSSNVLVDAANIPHVLDFGLAAPRHATDDETARTETARLTRTGEFMGTLAYMSPEHVSGDVGAIDVRSDVYSLGVLAYEALTGALPRDVSGSTFEALGRIHSTGIDPAPLRSLHRDLATVLTTALAHDPERRYAGAGALADELQRTLDGEAVDARRDSAVYVLRMLIARHRAMVAAALTVFVLALVAAAVSTTFWRRSERDRGEAIAQAERAGELSDFWQGLFDAIDPDLARGRRIDVREVLDSAAAKLRATPPSSPRAEAELAAAIGRTYHKLGRDDLGWSHLMRASMLADSMFGPDDPWSRSLAVDAAHVALVAAPLDAAHAAVAGLRRNDVEPFICAHLEAQLALREGDTARAVERMDEALALLQQVESADRSGAIGVLREMADLAFVRGDFVASARFAQAALPFADQLDGADSVTSLGLKQRAALALEGSGQRGLAIAQIDGVLGGFEARLGHDDPRTMNARFAAAVLRGRRDGFDDAHAVLADRDVVRTRLLARADLRAVETLGSLAQLLSDCGDPHAAADLYDDQLTILATFHDENAPRIAIAHVDAARARGATREGDACVAHARAALAILADAPADYSRLVASARGALATGLALEGQPADGIAPARAALALARASAGAGSTGASNAARSLAFVLSMSGDLQGAEDTLRAAVADRSLDAADRDAIDAALAHDLGDVLVQSFEAGEAELLLRDALELRRVRLGLEHPATAETANQLGVALFQQGKGPPELPGLWQDALETLEDQPHPLPALASVLNNLGAWAKAVEHDNESAEAYSRRALAVGEIVFDPRSPVLAISLANVAVFEQQSGDHGMARERLIRALAILEPIRGAEHPHVVQLRTMLERSERALEAE